MSDILTSKRVTARKAHRCWYCDGEIPVGAKYEYRTGVSYGDFWTMHSHPECDAYAHKYWDEDTYECSEPSSEHRQNALKEFNNAGDELQMGRKP